MSMIRRLCAAALIFMAWGFGPHFRAAAAQAGEKQGQGAIDGKALFEGTCAGCHGIDGSGGTGPSIRQQAATMGAESIISFLKNGFIGSAMPTYPQFGDARLQAIVDYLESLGREGAGVVTGDPAKGKEIYASSGCAKCHNIGGEGSSLGPDLSRIGAERGTAALRDALLQPGANPPLDIALAERAPYTAFVLYHAVTKDGQEITGMRVNEDSFSIQLKDANGHLHSLDKLRLEKLEALPGKSLMPSFKDTLSAAQLNDLLGYLASLKGAQ